MLQLRDVTRNYEVGSTRVHALDHVSLTVDRGECVAVVGRSGSGKSTLLHLIAALDAPSSGSIVVDGLDLDTLSRSRRARYRREMVGLIFQQFNLIPSMDAVNNVALPLLLGGVNREERTRRAHAALEKVGLSARASHRPVELSGGEQQRVAIARALVYEAPILLADEPTGNLDSKTARRILELLSTIHQTENRTMVLVTHSEEDAERISRRVLELRDGRIVATATKPNRTLSS